jgi:RNA polymerase sigma-70 factor, ECF subfamily
MIAEKNVYPENNPSMPAFDVLWAQTHHRLCYFVCSRVADGQDAEDLLQDIYLRIYRQSNSVRDPQRLESWMYQVARNRIIDHYRSRRQWTDLPETLAAEDEVEETPGAESMDGLLPYLQEAIASLPETYREALIQVDFQGMTQQDLASKLGVTLSGAKSRVQRARQKLKEALLRCFDFELDTHGGVLDYRRTCCC